MFVERTYESSGSNGLSMSCWCVCREDLRESEGTDSAGRPGPGVHGLQGADAEDVASSPHLSLAHHHHRTGQSLSPWHAQEDSYGVAL